MNKKAGLLLVVISLLVLNACKEKKEMVQDFYTISLGEHVFRIPAEYLMDADNRKDGAQRYVRVMAKIPDLTPYENATSYRNPPPRDAGGVSFNLNYGDGKKLLSDSLLRDWSTEGQNYVIPETWPKEGLIRVGDFPSAGKKYEIYAYVRNGEPVAQLRCGTYADWPNPGCNVYQAYDDRMMSIHVNFDIEQLDWYAREGLNKILRKVDSWRGMPEKH